MNKGFLQKAGCQAEAEEPANLFEHGQKQPMMGLKIGISGVHVQICRAFSYSDNSEIRNQDSIFRKKDFVKIKFMRLGGIFFARMRAWVLECGFCRGISPGKEGRVSRSFKIGQIPPVKCRGQSKIAYIGSPFICQAQVRNSGNCSGHNLQTASDWFSAQRNKKKEQDGPYRGRYSKFGKGK